MAFHVAAHQVSFQLANGELLFQNISGSFSDRLSAIVGINGVGKSVFAQLLSHRLVTHEGQIRQSGKILYVPQNWSGSPEDSVAEVLQLAQPIAAIQYIESGNGSEEDFSLADPWWDWPSQLDNALTAVGFSSALDLHRPVSSFSGGEQMRLMWASALLQKPDILIFDEPSNHLDAQGRERFTQWLANAREQIILVSHDRALLDHVDAIYELTPNALHRHPGNFSAYMESQQQRWQKQSSDLSLARREEKQTKAKAQEALEKQQQRTAKGKATALKRNWTKLEKNAAIDAAGVTQGHQKKLRQNREQSSASNAASAAQAKEWFDPIGFELPGSYVPPSKSVLTAENLAWGFAQPLCSPLSLSLKGAFRLHIEGANGTGKSVLLKTLMGMLEPIHGEHTVHVPYAYLDQHAYTSNPTLTAIETLLAKQPKLTEKEGRGRLAWLRLRNEKANVRFGDLSGGEQLKVILAIALLGKETPQLLLLDEPTNHLDLDSIVALENALTTFEGAMIIVSHDAHFVSRFELTHRLFLPEAELELV